MVDNSPLGCPWHDHAHHGKCSAMADWINQWTAARLLYYGWHPMLGPGGTSEEKYTRHF
jgi:hypothetical protein